MSARNSLELALLAARARQSPRTGFLHTFPQDDSFRDSIPLFENFCFALALFRQKTTESVLEGKALLERLFAFQTAEGNFPLFLHDYPKCWDFDLPLKIAPVLLHILKKFSPVLPASFKERLNSSLQNMERFLATRPLSPQAQMRLAACKGKWEPLSQFPETAGEWFDWIVSAQLTDAGSSFPIPFHTEMQLFLGKMPSQEKGEPQPLPIEYGLASHLSHRLMRDHLHQVYAALLFPFETSCPIATPFTWVDSTLYWQEEKQIHSLAIPGSIGEGEKRQFSLDSWDESDPFEVSCFLNLSPQTTLALDQGKGIVFRLGEPIHIDTGTKKLTLQFNLEEGEGEFCGRIFRGNRPNQVARSTGALEVFDWQIALRTLRRSGPCRLSLQVETFSPACCA